VAIQRMPHPRFAAASSVSSAAISHGTPFGSHISLFMPPSGAPGFTGGDHSWDRGFSEDFNKEEQGKVLLTDRREGEGYVGVLDDALASLVKLLIFNKNLPHIRYALTSLRSSAFPIHGHFFTVSPSTRYTSGARISVPRILPFLVWALVIKDSGDTVFGVWMGGTEDVERVMRFALDV
jgi:hypothetical protein